MTSLAAMVLVMVGARCICAQTAALGGRVSDQSGAIVPAANVTLNGSGGLARTTRSASDGSYGFAGLPPGDYSIAASAPQLMAPQVNLTLHPGTQSFDLQLKISVTAARVTVNAEADAGVSTDASRNADATVLTDADLLSLADDPDDLEADLMALAGPTAGPDAAEIFVDGFSGGQLPPKQSIREVRLNQNPFSPEYDKVGLGRIEIFTKPGNDAWHAAASYSFGTDRWDSRNPYAGVKAPFLLQETQDTIGGPITKRASFTLDLTGRAIDNGSISNGIVLDPRTMAATTFSSVLKTPQREIVLRPHVDYRLNETNYLAFTYTLARVNIPDEGIGAFDLISRGYHLLNNYDTAQLVETSVHGSIVNETHFQFHRWGYATTADTTGPFLQVLGAFNGGAASTPHNRDVQTSSELHNITSIVHGAHFFRFGARARFMTDNSYWLQNFNGTFTFGGELAPELDSNNQPVFAGGQEVMEQIPASEQYRRTLVFTQMGDTPAEIRALGGGASQFTINSGNPATDANRFDTAEFFGDDWRIRSNLTLNLGMRFESQFNIGDHLDIAPRFGIAWAPGATASQPGKTVVRAGFGIFYSRLALSDSVNALRYNGIVQQQYVVANPDFFPNVPSLASLEAAGSSLQSTQEIDSHFRSPWINQGAATLERQVTTGATLAVTYTNIHALHTPRSEDINAPMDYTGPGTGVYPYPNRGPIFLVTSSGLYNQNQLSFNVTSKWNDAVSLYATYILNKSISDTDGITTFPANPYNYSGEYGPAFNDIRQRVLFGGSVGTKWGIHLYPLLTFQTGAPFNITTGNDSYGTTLFNARPGIDADPTKPGLIQTPYGLLDPNPTPGEPIVGRNYGRGPFQIQTNLRLTRTWGFGKETSPTAPAAHPASRRYSLTLGLSARNILNHTNPGPIVGNITSPLFGQSNQLAGGVNGEGFSENANNRRLELELRFAF